MNCQLKIIAALAIILATGAPVAAQDQGSQLLPEAQMPSWIKPDSEPAPAKARPATNKITGPPAAAETARPAAQCDYSMCASKYRSFDPSTCTYQPYTGGPRLVCEP